jgi:signal transduction histidine kinase
LRRRLLRVGVGLAVVILALLDVQGLIQTLKAQARLRERVVHATRDATAAALPRLALMIRAGGAAAFDEAAREAIRSSLASEFEVFDPQGRALFSLPAAAPVEHWPAPTELASIGAGQPATFGPVAGEAPRLLTYASLRAGGSPVWLRLAVPVPELSQDLLERREMLVGHALSLVILVAAAGLALFPAPGGSEPSSQAALDAYEEAMRRLRERGLASDREHEAERRRLAHDLEDKEAMARAGELTAGIAHEVRNGLGTILGYARLLERSDRDAETRDVATQIRQECETLEGVVRRFMDFVRRDSLAPAPFDLARMLTRVVARESRSRPGPQAAVEGDLGALVGDEELLERAFENLVRNALEAVGDGGHVWIEGSRDERSQTVRVRDDGPGMTAEVLEGLRPFYTTKAGGLGLGLALAFKIVALHGGDTTLRPASPRGLIVSVRLPLEAPRTNDVTESSVTPQPDRLPEEGSVETK